MRAALSFGADGQFNIEAGPRDTDLLKQIPGVNHNHKLGCWVAKPAWSTALALRATFGEDLTVHESVNEWGREFLQMESLAAGLKAGLYEEALSSFAWAEDAYGFQVSGSALMSEHAQVLNYDEMGAGKTIQVAVSLRRLVSQEANPYPVLIVCTNSMKQKWAEELTKWVPEIHTFTVGGSAALRRRQIAEAKEFAEGGANVAVIANWESLRLHSRLAGYGSISLKRCVECAGTAGDPTLTEAKCEVHPKDLNLFGFRTVVLDEAHKAADPRAKQTRAAWALAHAATYRWALTGTPVRNSPEDLWCIMHGIDPVNWPSKSRFIDRYTISHYGGHGLEVFGFNMATKPEMDRFFEMRSIGRPKSVILPYLPPVRYETIHVEMGAKQAKAYEQMAEHMMTMIDSEILTAPDPLTQQTRLHQISAATPVIEVDADGRPQVTALAAPSCKIDALVDLIDERCGAPLVVFAESRKLLELAASTLDYHKIGNCSVTGKVPPEQRAANVAAFQDGVTQVILVSLGAGAEGITLTAADTAVFLQRSYKMTSNLQAEARIHRIGQEHDKVTYIDIITKGTLEYALHEVALNKEEILQEVVRDPAWVRRAIRGEV